MIAVSVIVPVYNVAIFLDECIKSIQNQTLKDIEIIIVNDGSTDDSLEVINKFAKVDPRFAIINKKNGGVSSARNAGLKIAKGEYISFIDADDSIVPNYLETLYNECSAKGLDVVVSRLAKQHMFFETSILYEQDFIRKKIVPIFIKEDGLNSVCLKLYKRKTILDNGIQFIETVHNGEDNLFNIAIFSIANKIKFIDYSGYNYKKRIGSATNSFFKIDYFNIALDFYKRDYDINFIDKNTLSSLKKERFFREILSILHRISYFDIKTILKNKIVSEVFNSKEIKNLKVSNYLKVIRFCVQKKISFGVKYAIIYSNYKNRK